MEDTLRSFLAYIESRAREDIRAVEEENRLRRQQETERFRQSAEQRAEGILRQGLSQVEGETSQLIAARQSEYRRELLAFRQSCARDTMARVRDKVRAYTGLVEYPERLVALTEKALQSLGSPAQAELYLRREDMPHGEYIRLRLKKTALSIREGDISMGGVIVADPKRGLRADLSFDTALADAQDRFGELSGLTIG